MDIRIAVVLLIVGVLVLRRSARMAAPSYFVDGQYVTLSYEGTGGSRFINTVRVNGTDLYQEAHTGQLDWEKVGSIDLKDMVLVFDDYSWSVRGWTIWPLRLPLGGKPIKAPGELTIGIPA